MKKTLQNDCNIQNLDSEINILEKELLESKSKETAKNLFALLLKKFSYLNLERKTFGSPFFDLTKIFFLRSEITYVRSFLI